MAENAHTHIALPNRSYQALARSEIKKIAIETGFTGNRLGEFEIIVAEITSNLIKHASAGGEILVKKIVDEKDNPGLELISLDNGPGMGLTSKMMQDGVSTSKTLGQGLGAIKRISHEFDIYSLKGWGTILLSRFYLRKPITTRKKSVEIKVLMIPKKGETACGDTCEAILKGNLLKFIIADGLGHGIYAAEASRQAVTAFRHSQLLNPEEALRAIHTSIKKTRGAVINITYIDFNTNEMNYCGVGNISSKVLSSKNKSFVSYNGIIGHSVPGTMNTHTYMWSSNDILILHSDGLNTRWDFQKYPQIQNHDAIIMAAALYKDHNRGNDDVTIAVIRNKKV